MSSKADIKQKLLEKGVKATSQRMVLYDYLCHTNSHPTVDQVYEAIKEEHPSISKATVYKTLDLFSEAGLAMKVNSIEGKVRYDANEAPHHHIYCKTTGDLIDFSDPELEAILESYFITKNIGNFKIEDIRLQIQGERIQPDKSVHYKLKS